MEHGPRTEEKLCPLTVNGIFSIKKWYYMEKACMKTKIKAKPGKLFHNGTLYCNVLTFLVYQAHLQMQLIHTLVSDFV